MAGTVYPDVLTTTILPDTLRTVYSTELEFTARPTLVFDQPAFVEPKPDFDVIRGRQAVFTIFRNMLPTISRLSENVDVDSGSIQDFQVSFDIGEYGYAMGVTEALDLLSYQGPVSNIIRSSLAPQMALTFDTIVRNALWYPSTANGRIYKSYGGTATSRTTLTGSSIIDEGTIRKIAHNLSIRRVATVQSQDPAYVAIAHPSVIYDLRGDSFWRSAQLYAGATRLFSGEEGMIHGVRFLKTDRARIPNGGVISAANSQTYLTASVPAGAASLPVHDGSFYTAGMEITLHNTGVASATNISGTVNWTAPDGQDPTTEEVVVDHVSGNTIFLAEKTLGNHSINDFVTEALDVYPVVFIGGIPPLGKGTLVEPEIRIGLPTDKLRRINHVGWYAHLGYGVIRPWAYEVLEVAATPSSTPAFGF